MSEAHERDASGSPGPDPGPGAGAASENQDLAEGLDPLLDRMEELLAAVEALDPLVREQVFELLDGVDTLHRVAVTRLAAHLGSAAVERSEQADPAVAWLWQAYGVGVDDVAAASRALDPVRPYLHEHGGDVEVLAVNSGVVRVRLAGSCAGCTSAAQTLQHAVAEALREGLPGFVGLDLAPDDAVAHPPPGPSPVLLQITPRPA